MATATMIYAPEYILTQIVINIMLTMTDEEFQSWIPTCEVLLKWPNRSG